MIKNKIKIYAEDFSYVESPSPIFVGKFCEALYFVADCIKNNTPKKRYMDIENIIKSTYIYKKMSSSAVEWFYRNKNGLTWDKLESLKQQNKIAEYIYSEIKKHFNSEVEPYNHTIISDEFYYNYILNKKKWIETIYDSYINCKEVKELPKILFYIILIEHCATTQHYFHVDNRGENFKLILKVYKKMFKRILEFTENSKYDFIEQNMMISKFGLIGEVDLLNSDNKIWEIKCVTDINLKNILQVLLYNIMYNFDENFYEESTDHETKIDFELNFINFLKGEQVTFKPSLNKDQIKQIVNIYTKKIKQQI